MRRDNPAGGRYRPGARSVLLLIVVCHLCSIRDACAYIDPGAGSYVFQLAIAFLVSGAFLIKGFWRRIVNFVRKLFSRRRDEQS